MKTVGRFLTKLLCLGLALSISGCGQGVSREEGAEVKGQGDQEGQEESPTLSLEEKLADDTYFYTEACRIALEYDAPKDLLYGGIWQVCMGAEGMGRYAFFHPEGWAEQECYSVIQMVDQEGQMVETQLSYGRQGAFFDREAEECDFFQLTGRRGIGLLRYRYPEPSQVCIVDEEGQVQARFPIPAAVTEAYGEDGTFLVPKEDVMADEACNLYLAWVPSDQTSIRFLVCDREGEKLWEEAIPGNEVFLSQLVSLPDGRVGCVFFDQTADGSTYYLMAMDLTEGVKELVRMEEKEWKSGKPQYITCYDEDTLLYATSRGLYRCDYQGRNNQELYLWKESGISLGTAGFIRAMRVQPDGDVEILLRRSREDFYLRLELATEKKEIFEVTFAVAKDKEETYRDAVADFNWRHGDCKIEMVVYEEPDRLLTEMIAGKGPVLVDTSLAPFADNEKLWECLEDALAQWGMEDALLAGPLEGGKIGGKQYGLCLSWSLRTFASVSYQEESWDYEQFLGYLENAESLEMLFEYQNQEGFLREFLCRSPEESIFIDPEAGRAYFDTERFTAAVELANRLAGEMGQMDSSEMAERIRSGSCLGEFVGLVNAEDIAYYDAKLGDQINYVGLPGKEGSCHYIIADDPVAVRATASMEEKEAALSFLKYLLGKQAQKNLVKHFYFSVRQDVFQEQLDGMPEELVHYRDGAYVTIPVDKEQAKERLLSIYEKAVPYPAMPQEIGQVLEEELSECFHGTRSVEEVAGILQNRVQLYLDERK